MHDNWPEVVGHYAVQLWELKTQGGSAERFFQTASSLCYKRSILSKFNFQV